MKVKGIGNEIHSGYIAIIGLITIYGFIYSYYKKYGNNNINDNINGIDIKYTDTAKIK